jgi:hypothetical protein
MRQHRYIRRAAIVTSLAAAALGGATMLGTTTAGADTACLTITFPAVRLIDWDGYNPKVEYSAAVPVDLSAGTYGLTGSSHDGYPSRTGVTQTSEIWELQFLDSGGAVVATSGLTHDLPDRVADANWTGSLGTVTLPAGTASVRAHHRPDAVADGSANSVVPVSAVVCPTGADSSTTVAPTTTAPPTSTTSATSTTVASTSTTVAPTSTTPTSAPPSTAPVRSESTVRTGVLAETLERVATTTTPTVRAAALASTGSSSKPLGGIALVALGLGILVLGYRAGAITRRG